MISPHEVDNHLSGAGGLRVGSLHVEATHPGAPGLESPSDHAANLPTLRLAHSVPVKDILVYPLYKNFRQVLAAC